MILETSDKFIEEIGLKYVLQLIKTSTPYGKTQKKELYVFNPENQDDLEIEYENIDYFLKLKKKKTEFIQKIKAILKKTKEIRLTLINLERNKILDIVELFLLKYHSLLNQELLKLLKSHDLQLINKNLPDLSKIIAILDPKKKGVPSFAIYNSFSKKLEIIRQKKEKIEIEINNSLDESAKEKLKIERIKYIHEEKEEEKKIRNELTEKLGNLTSELKQSVNFFGYIDWIIAKAELASEYMCSKPQINSNNTIRFESMYNPFIQNILELKDSKFIPIDLEITFGVSVITGANMGGKTVCLKTLMLNTLLAQMGFFVFSKSAKIRLFDFYELISDDLQNIRSGISTFAAEIIRINNIIKKLKNKHGFVLFDEIARGTNPIEGKIIVQSIVEYLNLFESMIVITTHYDFQIPAEVNHYQVCGLKNQNFYELKTELNQIIKNNAKNKSEIKQMFEIIQLLQKRMDYNIEKVSHETPIPKEAIKISNLLNIDPKLAKIFEKNTQNK